MEHSSTTGVYLRTHVRAPHSYAKMTGVSTARLIVRTWGVRMLNSGKVSFTEDINLTRGTTYEVSSSENWRLNGSTVSRRINKPLQMHTGLGDELCKAYFESSCAHNQQRQHPLGQSLSDIAALDIQWRYSPIRSV